MAEIKNIHYEFIKQIELNYAYMPFVVNGGLFIKQKTKMSLFDEVKLSVIFTWINETLEIDGKIVWITPIHALNHAVPGFGIQFLGKDALFNRQKIESLLDISQEIGGYTSLKMDSFDEILL